ncbi:MAG: amino acid adenylation domain-containing protein [Corynebacterium sp.]|nr:amino acid adenylation domain-containing protein [Corynebacterium sp.]
MYYTPSRAQQGILLSEFILGSTSLYGVAEITDIKGAIDIQKFLLSAKKVLNSEPALRSLVKRDENDGFQLVGPGPTIQPEYIPCYEASEPQSTVDLYVSRALNETIDTQKAIVTHACLFDLGDEHYQWFLRIHHIAADGFAFGLINHKIAKVYRQFEQEALANEEECALEQWESYKEVLADEQPISDVSRNLLTELQRAWQTSIHLRGGGRAVLGDPGHPAVQPISVGSTLRSPHPAILIGSAALSVAATRTDCFGDDSTTVLVGFYMMNRFGGAAMRSVAAKQNLVVLPIEVRPAQSVADFLAQVNSQWEKFRALQRCRFEDIREYAQLSASDRAADIVVNLVPFAGEWQLGRARASSRPIWDGPVEDLIVDIRFGGGVQDCVLKAPGGAYTHAELTGHGQLFARYLEVLQASQSKILTRNKDAVVALADRKTESENTVAETEINTLPGDSSLSTVAEVRLTQDCVVYPRIRGASIPVNLNERLKQVGRGNHLLVDTKESLNASQSELRIARICTWLHRNQVRPGDLVGVAISRSTWNILAPLALWNYGAVFVPIDPDWPAARKEHIRKICDIEVLMDDACTAEISAIDAATAHKVFYECVQRQPKLTDLAYVLFTSGTTGAPKGVMVQRAQVASYINTVLEVYLAQILGGPRHNQPLRVIAGYAFSFDSALSAVAMYLLGQSIYVPPADVLEDIAAYADFVQSHRIEIIDAAPRWIAALLAEGFDLDNSDVRAIIVGGDQCPPELWQQFRKLSATGIQIANAYGPTENTVDATLAWVTQHPNPSIGYPLPRQEIRIRNWWGMPLPAGLQGELCVAGANVAAGYYRDSEQTAQRFISTPQGREYHTGDLVCQEADGAISYLGRVDQQISVNGIRVEPEEIAKLIRQYKQVADCVVGIPADAQRNILVAWVQLKRNSLVHPDEAIAHIQQLLDTQLPSRQRPKIVQLISSIPLTERGKVDIQKLKITQDALPQEGQAYEDMGQQEQAIAKVVADVLTLDPTTLRADTEIFALGASSLELLRIIARLQKSGVIVTRTAEIFAHPSIAILAQHVRVPSSIDEEDKGVGNALVPAESFSTQDAQVAVNNHAVDGEYTAGNTFSLHTGQSRPASEYQRMTSAQQRLWYFQKQYPESAAYCVPIVLHAKRDLSRDKLEAAWRKALQEFPSLHSTYRHSPERGLHLYPASIEDHRSYSIEVVADVKEWLADPATKHFDVEYQLPARIAVETSGHTCGIMLHHIAADGAGIQRFLTRFGELYSIEMGASLTTRSITTASRNLAHMADQTESADLEWWRRYLQELPTTMEIPLDHPRPETRSSHGGEYRQFLGERLSQQIQSFARQHALTPYIVLRSAFALFLSKISGSAEVIFGTVFAGHDLDNVDVRYAANTITTRNPIDPRLGFGELCVRLQERAAAEFVHAGTPFDAVVAALRPARKPNIHPLFQVMFVYQDAPLQAAAFGDAGVTAEILGNGHAKFDLTLEILPQQDAAGQTHYELRWEYATDVLTLGSVENFSTWYCQLLQDILQFPNAPVTELSVDRGASRALCCSHAVQAWQSGQQIQAILQQDNATDLVRALQSSFGQYCSNIALEDTCGKKMTYQELSEAACSIAAALQSQGVGPGDVVALFYPRNIDQVLAIVGVLFTGATYVPLDPEYPAGRIQVILEDAAVVHVLADASIVNQVQQLLRNHGLEHCPVQSTTELLSFGETQSYSPVAITPDTVAYIIFTSGSTGRPKGVAVSHQNIIRLFWGTRQYFAFHAQDVWSLFHSYAFDFAVWETFGALLHGAKLVVFPYELTRSPTEFREMAATYGITVLNMTPSAFAQFVIADSTTTSTLALRYIIFGGEALDGAMVRQWFQRHGESQPQLVNMYGITEGTVHVTYHQLSCKQIDFVGIGRPLPDLAIYLLDTYGQPVPMGVVGEMYVGGAGVAAGYYGRPELTRQRFVPDPFMPGSGKLMYKTGDLARWGTDGILYFEGRSDRQIQLRGFRIELGELEAAAQQNPHVQWAFAKVVTVHNSQKLVLYLVVKEQEVQDPMYWRQEIARTLPAQMAPNHVRLLEEIPLTVNGKLDEAALPPIEFGQHNSVAKVPASPIQAEICRAFAQTLGYEHVAPQDSFFDLGGHSLLAVQAALILKETVDPSITVGAIMTHPTAELLASSISGDGIQQHLNMQIPLRRGSATWQPEHGALYCIHPAGGLSWCYSGIPKYISADIPVWGFQASGILDPETQPATLQHMAQQYVDNIMRNQPTGPIHLLGWSLGGMVAQAMAVLLTEQGRIVATLALLDAYPAEAEHNIDRPPLYDAISAVLAMAGLDDAALTADPTLAELEEQLRGNASPLSDLSRTEIHRLVQTYRNTAKILREHEHSKYCGDLIFYLAQNGGIGPEHYPEEWEDYIGGAIHVIPVAANHREMTQPGALSTIGPDLNQRILAHILGAKSGTQIKLSGLHDSATSVATSVE